MFATNENSLRVEEISGQVFCEASRGRPSNLNNLSRTGSGDESKIQRAGSFQLRPLLCLTAVIDASA